MNKVTKTMLKQQLATMVQDALIFVFLSDGRGLVSSSGGGLTCFGTNDHGPWRSCDSATFSMRSLVSHLFKAIRGKGILHAGHGKKEWLEVHTCMCRHCYCWKCAIVRGKGVTWLYTILLVHKQSLETMWACSSC